MLAAGQQVHVQMKDALARIRAGVDHQPVSPCSHMLLICQASCNGRHMIQQARLRVSKLLHSKPGVGSGMIRMWVGATGMTVAKRQDRLVAMQHLSRGPRPSQSCRTGMWG